MHWYRYSDVRIASNVAIPFLPTPPDREFLPTDISLHVALAPSSILRKIERQKTPQLPVVTRGEDGHWLQVSPDTIFFINESLDEVKAYWTRSGNASDAVRIFVDHVMPRILAKRGRTIVHASCVAYDGLGILFLGESGRGKSTLALAHCHYMGAELVADDCVELVFDNEGMFAVPTYRAHRVWPDSGTILDGDYVSRTIDEGNGSKLKILPLAHSAERFQVKAVCFIGIPSDQIALSHTKRIVGVLDMMKQRFSFSSNLSRSELETSMDDAERIFQYVPCLTLSYPRDYRRLGAAVRASKQLLGSSLERLPSVA